MALSIPRIFIAAAHKSSGKTTISIGLAAALRARGRAVRMFKKGPDYIDPLWHRLASGRDSYNLDFNTQEREEMRALFARKGREADICLIEANKGLYDGIALDGSDSNAAVAELLDAPVVLVIDCEGMTRGIAPLLLGYAAFGENIRIAGVILNRVGGPRHEAKLRAAVERYTDIPVLGAVGKDASMSLRERHLGLTTPGDMAVLDERMAAIGARVAAGVDMARLEDAAARAPALDVALPPEAAPRKADLRIAIARDAAFCFYYPDDLEAFAAAGAELVFFSPISDAALPENIDGLFLGGGFPETHMAALADNRGMRAAIAAAIAGGLPAYAECGGLMYLAESLAWKGERAPMCSVVPGRAVMNTRPQGRGVIRLAARENAPWRAGAGDGEVAAHEFHYASLHGLPGDASFAWDVLRGSGIDGRHDGVIIGNLVAGFTHLRNTQKTPWVEAFCAFARARKG